MFQPHNKFWNFPRSTRNEFAVDHDRRPGHPCSKCLRLILFFLFRTFKWSSMNFKFTKNSWNKLIFKRKWIQNEINLFWSKIKSNSSHLIIEYSYYYYYYYYFFFYKNLFNYKTCFWNNDRNYWIKNDKKTFNSDELIISDMCQTVNHLKWI
jgi:hypothetical protein